MLGLSTVTESNKQHAEFWQSIGNACSTMKRPVNNLIRNTQLIIIRMIAHIEKFEGNRNIREKRFMGRESQGMIDW